MNDNNVLPYCIKERCDIDDVNKNNISMFMCSATPQGTESLSLPAQQLSCPAYDRRSQFDNFSVGESFYVMRTYDRHSVQSFYRIWHIQCTVIVTLIAITISRAIIRCSADDGKSDKFKIWLRYLLEFIIISLSIILSVNVANPYVELIVLFAFLMLIIIMWYTSCWHLASKRGYVFGRRPTIFTLMRSSINIITAVCILAIDFEGFPKEFRKSRRYGVGLMDVGIGLFVFSMGLVSSRPHKWSDMPKIVFTVGCLFILGLARTLVITAIDYHQDEHEYGIHLNAFFTLAFTKLFATLFGFLAKSNNHLFTIGLVILLTHEAVLQFGVWQYVMDPDVKRTNFISSNREGLCSLPGFIALYLLSQYLGKWLQSKDILNFEEIKTKLKALSLISILLWLLVVLAIFVIGIARVTCNLGYVFWILAIAVTIFTFYLFIFDIVLDTLTPVSNETNKVILTETSISHSIVNSTPKIPLVLEAINFNGLTFFLLANILTGCTNIFFATDEKTNLESIIILFIYMFITTTFVFKLYRLKIRIA